MVDVGLGGLSPPRTRRVSPQDAAQRAAYHLLRSRPEASAGRELWPPLPLILGPGLFALGLWVCAPSLVAGAALVLVYTYILALAALRLAAALITPKFAPRAAVPFARLPPMSVIVALYRESEVVAGLCAGLNRLRYPRDRLDVILVLEENDCETQLAATAAARRHGFRVLVVPECGPQTKPRALNYALQHARGQLITVYDAEDAPHADQLIAAAESFIADPGLGVVQAPLSWYNAGENWLTRQFALEYAAQFHGLLPLFARLGMPLPLGGTSNVFRVSALVASGGWDPFNVTEDADLGFRLARMGWKASLITPGTGEEAPTTLSAWTGQRSRWLKGHLVTWLVQMRQPVELCRTAGVKGLAGLQLCLLANVFSALAHLPGLVLACVGLVMLARGDAGIFTLAGLGLGGAAFLAALACLWVSAGRAGQSRRATDLVTAPIYWLCQLPAAWRALRELGSQPYVWAKTRHGVSLTRREAPDDPAGNASPDGDCRRPVRPVRLAVEPAH